MSRDSGLAHLTGSCQRAGQVSRSLQGWKVTDWMPRMDLPCRQKSFPSAGEEQEGRSRGAGGSESSSPE